MDDSPILTDNRAMKSYERRCFSVRHSTYQRNEFCETCDTASRSHDRGLRQHLIQVGLINAIESRPTLRLAPGERERFEAQALADFDAWLSMPVAPVPEFTSGGGTDVWN